MSALVWLALAWAVDDPRPFAPQQGGEPVLDGISYGPYRDGQRPGGPEPTEAQLLEDLRLLAPDWHLLRVYSSRGSTEAMLRLIETHDLPIQVMLGAWLAPDDAAANQAELDAAVRLAKAYPEVVVAVSVGNETQVDWSAHRSPQEGLVAALQEVRGQITQPVTTADDYNFWNKPASKAVADQIDFLTLHAYAMWNGKSLDEALAWTARTVADIRTHHPELPIVLGETGWATELDPEGREVKHIHAPAGEAEQARFFSEWVAWARENHQPYFWFEAFDEPWKGSDNPREVEKHWGLYRVDRTPKPAVSR